MSIWKLSFFLVLWSIVVTLGVIAYVYNTKGYPIEIAISLLNRAEATGSVESMIEYVESCREILESYSGNPVWFYPTKYTDFDLIKRDLHGCLERLRILKTLPRDSDAFNQGIDDIRDRLDN